MLRDTLLCRRAISGVSRKVWRHTKFTLDKIDLASEPKKQPILSNTVSILTLQKFVLSPKKKVMKLVCREHLTTNLVCRGLKSLRTTGLIHKIHHSESYKFQY